MNLITQYEQGYLSLSDFINEFPNSISKSQEALCGSECVEFYVAIRNSTLETGCARTCLFVIKSYYSLKKVYYHFTSLLSCCIILIIPIDTTWHITRRVFMKGKEKKKENDVFSTIEKNRRIDTGMPAGDPNIGTKWTDTLIYFGVILVLFILYVLFFK